MIKSLISALHFDDHHQHIQHLILLQGVDGDRDERMGAATRNLALSSTQPGQTDKWGIKSKNAKPLLHTFTASETTFKDKCVGKWPPK